MRASAFDPLSIPPAFWERPEVCQALRKRDMGTLFTLIHEHTGLSQTRIGTAVGLGQGRISEVVNGSRGIRYAHVFERIADGLDMPDHARIMLGLPPRQIRASGSPRSITPARSGQDSDLLRQITAARSIDSTVVRVLQGETDNIRLLDRRLGAPAVAGKLEAHISHIETGLRYSLRPGNRQQLAAVLADASALAGWQSIDMGRLPRAWAHFERATAAAVALAANEGFWKLDAPVRRVGARSFRRLMSPTSSNCGSQAPHVLRRASVRSPQCDATSDASVFV